MTLRLSNDGKAIAVRVDLDSDTTLSNRKKGLLLSNVSIFGRKGIAKEPDPSSKAVAS
jgi:hypothetical protein